MSQPKIAVVTGAGTGVGRAAALALLGGGWTVVLTGRRKEPLEESIAMAGDAAARALAVPTDVADPASVDALFATVKSNYGRLDLLFNNAGQNVPGMPFEDLTYADWTRVVAVNLTGCFLCAQAAFRIMKDQSPQGGRIINNGSISAHTPRPDSAPYTATKHSITGLTKSLMLDGRKYDICAGQIDIGNAATPMTARMSKGVKQADGTTAVEPTMDVNHVGQAILHMANLPLESNIFTLTIKATKMPFEGRG
ncbi:SDR family oxidoreductase [Roseomonas terrae]|jgi:NAD(P)-dependent dehydrogenase (short-subunit alcohol dehydrogenase family)|uniref:SDR family oxidoreductase n=1 Tax=Neoroseomonas terrae TaxID=424799 RepID=A0ABS5EMP9_9PROT|nr:SDR family oxidoreductase [Neoroseomonas terrae]MBR0652235.1 SDR family oxidoreductase [Neoroseomonas terrae]